MMGNIQAKMLNVVSLELKKLQKYFREQTKIWKVKPYLHSESIKTLEELRKWKPEP